MGENIAVRVATPDDVDRLVEVHTQGRLAYYTAGGLSPEEVDSPVWRQERHTGWSRGIESAQQQVWCATLGGEVVGAAAMGLPHAPEVDDGATGQLFQIHVLPDRWGHGVGGLLHGVFLRYLAEVSRPTGFLEVWERNERARSFYARHGWRPDGTSRPGPAGSRYLNLRLAVSAGT
ncbi:GNAT family N-acetyltransferase [Micromonospora cathayae]|uniref:GNAT family N-acetyltransferase n=1 Tax=Micromonospora cathayae TaxID=3028804 RepID=A0ABY7ZHX3_9ACTN|nr:GNAT family N-acetyltransferase [Micromonospora sp. HUAS 3]WDZ82582.1 GNAT family N-acetyltransferase [Micromonospora sp. HUAS 3]